MSDKLYFLGLVFLFLLFREYTGEKCQNMGQKFWNVWVLEERTLTKTFSYLTDELFSEYAPSNSIYALNICECSISLKKEC